MEIDGKLLEAVLRIIGHITNLLHPGHEHLMVVALVMRGLKKACIISS
jgi:hypothetical protein